MAVMPSAIATFAANVATWILAGATKGAIHTAITWLVEAVIYAGISAGLEAIGGRDSRSPAKPKRDATTRGSTEAERIIYGEPEVGGVIVYQNVYNPSGSPSSELWTVQTVAGHAVNSIHSLRFDDDDVTLTFAGDGGGTGLATGGKYYIDSTAYVQAFSKYGSATQTHLTQLTTNFPEWDNTHDGKGVSYIATRLILDGPSQEYIIL